MHLPFASVKRWASAPQNQSKDHGGHRLLGRKLMRWPHTRKGPERLLIPVGSIINERPMPYSTAIDLARLTPLRMNKAEPFVF